MEEMIICQSCTMPLEDDPNQGGTEADGSSSELFCSFCYTEGDFTTPDLTLEEMEQITRQAMEREGIDDNTIELSIRLLPALERWREEE